MADRFPSFAEGWPGVLPRGARVRVRTLQGVPPGLTSPFHLLVVIVVALIVLGPERLPGAMRQAGRALAELRQWSSNLQDEVQNALSVDPTEPEGAPSEAGKPVEKDQGGAQSGTPDGRGSNTQ